VTQVRWKIHKFGGSSLADADCFRRVAAILGQAGKGPLGVVVSAMGGMTDQLLGLTRLAASGDGDLHRELQAVGDRYAATARELLGKEPLASLLEQWQRDSQEIEHTLSTIADIECATQRSSDLVSGYGEIWSARLLAALLEQQLGAQRAGTWIDARRVLTVRHSELGPAVQWARCRNDLAREIDAGFSGVAVITGYIASDEEGLHTTLGRNGSDFSAAIFAALLDAAELCIWTDVDGVMSADPRRVPEAQIIDRLSYNEAMELAYFGAKVIHPQTLGPVIENDIPVLIRNTFRPDEPGSRIEAGITPSSQIKGITEFGHMALVNVEGTGMIGVPGTADRLFAALKDAGVSVSLISQASSERSICIAVPVDLAELIAVVGDGMAGTPGIAAKFFGTLGRAGINIRAIAQGSSERNISAVIDSEDATRALRAAHSGFYLSAKTISIGLIGCGTVGSALLDQLATQSERLRRDFNLDLRVRAIARSSSMILGERRIALEDWRNAVADRRLAIDFDRFEAHVNPDHLPHAVIIDCTADDGVARRYPGWLGRGIHVITPNKKAFSGSQEEYHELEAAARHGNTHYFYETTVGAALPIIKTIRDQIDTGDRIHSIKGILSGTLAYLFNVYDGSTPFSGIVRNAQESGFTEPDPRDDLSGMDVARKLTILAREMGQSLEIGDFPVENLIPEALRDASTAEFLAGLAEYDDAILARYREAAELDRKLRYVASLDADGHAAVRLEATAAQDAFSKIELTDNIVQFRTDRYADNPLIVQGPGAGPQVTAGGVFGDLLRLATFLGDGTQL
jgi:aspartokinase/homoserine dehydrogenase 1